MRRRNPAELLLLNPAATRALTMPEVAQVIRDLNVPDAWRTPEPSSSKPRETSVKHKESYGISENR